MYIGLCLMITDVTIFVLCKYAIARKEWSSLKTLAIDIETYSSVSIQKCGVYGGHADSVR